MSQINFVEQFNLFMQFAKRNKLSSYERMFYIALFYCANDLARTAENHEWPDDYFPVSNAELTSWSNFDERAIRNTRNTLKQKGLLDFKKGDGKKSDPMYRIHYMRRIGYEIAPDDCLKPCGKPVIGGKFAADTVGDSVGDTVGDAVGGRVGDDPRDYVLIGSENAADTVGDTDYKRVYVLSSLYK